MQAHSFLVFQCERIPLADLPRCVGPDIKQLDPCRELMADRKWYNVAHVADVAYVA